MRQGNAAATAARIRFATALATVVVFALALALLAPPADAGPAKQGPPGPRFYDPPKKKLKRPHGRIVWQRAATGVAPIEGAKRNRTVLYTSRSPQGRRIGVSGSVSIPPGKPPKGGWPVITYAHGTTGSADACAPTRVSPTSPVALYVAYVDPQLQAWIAAGYAVVRTDYQGLGTPGPHPYLVGESAGRSVLDIVAAARRAFPLSRRFVIAGHSQGGHASLFAASLAPRWTPGLKLRGAVSYAPASHLLEQAKLLPSFNQPSSLSAEAALIVAGAATAAPAIDVDTLLSPQALRLWPQLEQRCLPGLATSGSFGGLAPAKLLRNNADTGPLYGQLAKENPAVKIPAPVLLAQGTADTTVFPPLTDALAGQLRELGDDIRYRKYPGVNHAGIVFAAEADALAFFERRLPTR